MRHGRRKDLEQWLRAARRGDEQDRGRLFLGLQRIAERMARNRLGKDVAGYSEAADIAADAIVRLVEKFDRIEPPESLGALISFTARAVRCCCIDEYRRSHTLKAGLQRTGRIHDGIPSQGPSATLIAEAKETRDRLRWGLSRRETLILELAEQGYAGWEIGQRLGVGAWIVQRIIARIRTANGID